MKRCQNGRITVGNPLLEDLLCCVSMDLATRCVHPCDSGTALNSWALGLDTAWSGILLFFFAFLSLSLCSYLSMHAVNQKKYFAMHEHVIDSSQVCPSCCLRMVSCRPPASMIITPLPPSPAPPPPGDTTVSTVFPFMLPVTEAEAVELRTKHLSLQLSDTVLTSCYQYQGNSWCRYSPVSPPCCQCRGLSS